MNQTEGDNKMKEKFMLLLLGISTLLLTGCSLKTTVEISVDQDQTVSEKYVLAMDDEMLDAFLSLSDTNLGEQEEKVYTDEDRWHYIENDMVSDYKGFEYMGRFDENGMKGCILNRKMGKLEDTVTNDNTPIRYDDIADLDKIFVKNGNEYSLHFIPGENTQTENGVDTDQLIDNGAEVTQEMIIHLPYKAKTHNATKVSEDGLTYTWDLLSQEEVKLTFEIPTSEDPISELKDEVIYTTPWENASDWALMELLKANDSSLIPAIFNGTDFTTHITRKEFAHAAVKLYEKLTGQTVDLTVENPFTDADDVGVLKALQLGITNGTTETTFSPDALITREQMATMMTRALSKAGVNTTVDLENVELFADDSEMHTWGREAIYYMASIDVIKGVGENRYNVNGNATKEQALLISVRSLEKTRP